MNRFVMRATALAALALCQPVFADEISDLKAEIAAQKAAAQAQQARLEALEQKLNGVVQQQQAAAAKPAPAAAAGGASYTAGEGLSYVTANGSVTLYGLIDVSYVHTDHVDTAGHSLNAPRVAWFSGNRWGITGTRSMGDSGLNAIFRLESEYESQTGNMDTAGTLFNRDAWAGLQSASFGKLTLGRQNAIARDPSGSAIYGDPYGPAAPSTEEGGYTNNNNFKQLIFYAGSAGGTRMNNSVVWKKAFDGGLVAGLAYQFGTTPGNASNGTTESVTLAYGGGAFNVAGYATTAKVGNLSDNSYSVGGNYTIGMIRVNAGVFRYTGEQGALGNRSDNAYTVSAKIAPGGKIDYQIGYQDMKANHAAVSSVASGSNVLNAFADASAATATATGSRSTLYGSAFYHFDKNTEVYVAGDYLKLKDAYHVSTLKGSPSQTEFAVGLRTRF
jgi:predicted porin